MASNQDKVTGVDTSALQSRVDAVAREVKYLSQQNTSLFNGLEQKLNNLKREFAYLNQQNLSVYNMTKSYVQDTVNKTQAALEEKIKDLKSAIDSDGPVMPNVEVVVDYERIVDGVVKKLSQKSAKAETTDEEDVAIETVGEDGGVNYDALAEKIAENMPPVDYDYLATKIVNNLIATDYDQFAAGVAEKIAENIPQQEMPLGVDAEAVADSVVARIQETGVKMDAETLADSVADKVVSGIASLDGESFATTVADKVLGVMPTDSTDIDAIVDGVMARIQDTPVEVDAEALAATLAERIQLPPLEVDFEELAENIANKIDLSNVQVNAETAPVAEIDYDAIAAKIMEALPDVDYDTMSLRLAEKLNGSEEDVEAYLNERGIEVDETDSSDRVISAVEENSGKTNALVEEVIELLKQRPVAAVVAVEEPVEEEVEEAPVQELVDEPAEEVEEVVEAVEEPAGPTPEEIAAMELSIAEAAEKTAAMEAAAEEQGKTVRLKRSYECKLRQSSDDVKYYYSEIKNELLSYTKVKSGMSWNGDRYNYGRDTIAKMSINGKTLCLYLALNPDEYSITKYHHKYVGNVKAYESTPMLLKVKSSMGLKKAIALIYEMMEGLKAQRNHKDAVDYVAEYAYKSDEQLIAEGLIKASMTEKKDLSSF